LLHSFGVKVKWSLAVKTYRWSKGIASLILNLSGRWRGMVSFYAPASYPLGKRHWYPPTRRLGGLNGWFVCCGEEKNFWPMLGI